MPVLLYDEVTPPLIYEDIYWLLFRKLYLQIYIEKERGSFTILDFIFLSVVVLTYWTSFFYFHPLHYAFAMIGMPTSANTYIFFVMKVIQANCTSITFEGKPCQPFFSVTCRSQTTDMSWSSSKFWLTAEVLIGPQKITTKCKTESNNKKADKEDW